MPKLSSKLFNVCETKFMPINHTAGFYGYNLAFYKITKMILIQLLINLIRVLEFLQRRKVKLIYKAAVVDKEHE